MILGISSPLRHRSPREWAAKHKALGLEAVVFPVDHLAGEEAVMAYEAAADEAGLRPAIHDLPVNIINRSALPDIYAFGEHPFQIFGGFLILLGGFTVLVELFEHLTFGTAMFRWSLYSLLGFGAAGIFFLLAGMIPSLRRTLEKRFFF